MKEFEEYLAKLAVDDFLNTPTLDELFRDYTPKLTKNGLVFYKKNS